MLKIKQGSSINHYGDGHTIFTSETPLAQPILAHLQTMYPDAIEDDEALAAEALAAEAAATKKAKK